MARTKGALGKKTLERQIEQGGVTVTDGFLDAFTGMGTNRDRTSYARMARPGLMGQADCSIAYLGDGFARKIVDVPAEEMTRSGIKLDDLEDEELEHFVEARFDDLDAMRHFNDAVAWSRLHGGAVMIFGLNDGGTLDVPLNPQGIKAVDFLRVYDRWQATIQTRVTDPMSEQYGKPEMWLISPVNGGMPYKVHNSRLWVFDGDRIPDHDRAANQGWGASALQACQDQLKRLGMGHQWTLAILERAQQAVHKIPRLAQTLQAPGGEKMIQKRVDVVDMVRGILNTIVVDGDESYDVTTATLTGYTDVLDRFAEAVSAVTSIPVSILMGRSQGGLSNTDKATMDAWYARIESMWNDILRKPQDKLVQYIMIAKNGEAPDYKLCMRPLSVLSATEQAEVDYKQAQAFKARAEGEIALITANVLDPLEVRENYSEDYELFSASPDNNPEPDPAANNGNQA